jgi:hypothetical protein
MVIEIKAVLMVALMVVLSKKQNQDAINQYNHHQGSNNNQSGKMSC